MARSLAIVVIIFSCQTSNQQQETSPMTSPIWYTP